MLGFVSISAFGAFALGQAIGSGATDDVLSYAPLTAAGVWFVLAAMIFVRTLQQTARPDGLDGLLTTVPYRDVVGGLVLTELAGLLLYIGIPVLAVPLAFAVGAGSVLAFVSMLVALVSVGSLGLLSGMTVGFAVKSVAIRSEFVARYKSAIWIIAALIYVGIFATQSQGRVFLPVVRALSGPPLGWFADLALLPVVPGTSAVHATLAVVIAVVGLPLLIAVLVIVAGTLWYTDPATSESEAVETETSTRAGPFERLVDHRTAWVAQKSWLRARRAPIKLSFVAYPFFFVATQFAQAIESGTFPATLPPFIAIYGAWAVGAAFTLNPLGDEGAVLPVTITSGIPGRTFVRGLVAAGVSVGVPIVAVLTLIVGLLSDLPASVVITLTVVSAALCVGASGLATGIGTAFPRFDAARVGRSREAVVPSYMAFVVYSVVLIVCAAPGLATSVPLVADGLSGLVGVSSAAIRIAGAVVTVVLVGVLGSASYWYASRTFDQYTM